MWIKTRSESCYSDKMQSKQDQQIINSATSSSVATARIRESCVNKGKNAAQTTEIPLMHYDNCTLVLEQPVHSVHACIIVCWILPVPRGTEVGIPTVLMKYEYALVHSSRYMSTAS